MMSGKADPSYRSDDIAQLRQYLDMPTLNYQDISMMVGVQQALQRWPLLGEGSVAHTESAAQGRAALPETATP
ncbi:cellulose biosynthesis protein BcsR [Pseudomonas putida]